MSGISYVVAGITIASSIIVQTAFYTAYAIDHKDKYKLDTLQIVNYVAAASLEALAVMLISYFFGAVLSFGIYQAIYSGVVINTILAIETIFLASMLYGWTGKIKNPVIT